MTNEQLLKLKEMKSKNYKKKQENVSLAIRIQETKLHKSQMSIIEEKCLLSLIIM